MATSKAVYFTISVDGDEQRPFVCRVGGLPLRLGRATNNDVVLQGSGVSANHMELRAAHSADGSAKLFVHDRSTNGVGLRFSASGPAMRLEQYVDMEVPETSFYLVVPANVKPGAKSVAIQVSIDAPPLDAAEEQAQAAPPPNPALRKAGGRAQAAPAARGSPPAAPAARQQPPRRGAPVAQEEHLEMPSSPEPTIRHEGDMHIPQEHREDEGAQSDQTVFPEDFEAEDDDDAPPVANGRGGGASAGAARKHAKGHHPSVSSTAPARAARGRRVGPASDDSDAGAGHAAATAARHSKRKHGSSSPGAVEKRRREQQGVVRAAVDSEDEAPAREPPASAVGAGVDHASAAKGEALVQKARDCVTKGKLKTAFRRYGKGLSILTKDLPEDGTKCEADARTLRRIDHLLAEMEALGVRLRIRARLPTRR